MTLTTPRLLTAAVAVAATTSAAAVPVTFTDFLADSPVTGAGPVDLVADGVTATFTATAGTFSPNAGGLGITSSTAPGSANANIDDGEGFDLRFDTDGTLNSITVRAQVEEGTITLTNGTETASGTIAGPAGGDTSGVLVSGFDLDFSAGDVLTLTSDLTLRTNANGNVINSGYRIQAIDIDAVPEPGSLALAAGGAVLLLRRRKA